MSCYDEERGSWQFPAKNWNKVRQDLIDAEFSVKENQYKLALALWEKSKTMGAATFKGGFEQILEDVAISVFGSTRNRFSGNRIANYPSGWCSWSFRNGLEYGTNGKIKKPSKPKKRKKENEMSFDSDCGTVFLAHNSRYIEWCVDNNNRAVDSSWNHPVGRKLNEILRRTEFKGSNGGYCIYRSEYDESFEPNYTHVYGPLAKKQCWGRR